MPLSVSFGSLGEGQWYDNAIANAAFLNEVQPYLIFTSTYHGIKDETILDDYPFEAIQRGSTRRDSA